MRQQWGKFPRWGVLACCLVVLSACAARQTHEKGRKRAAANGTPALDLTPMPTVPPATPLPEPAAQPVPTRPVGTHKQARKGEIIGEEITFFGAVRADGSKVQPESVDKNGIPTYVTAAGSGFMIVVEAKPGRSGHEVARRVFAHVPDDPTVRPDLEIEANRDLGDGSSEVCDRRKPKIGGIPGINPQSFAETQRISDALNDFSCRFETFIESDSSCTLDVTGDYAFMNKESTTQFCVIVARAYSFPVGDTLLSVRVRDVDGNPGPVKQMRIRRPPEPKPPGK